MTYDTVITDSHIILPQGMVDKNILIDEGKIVGFTNDILLVITKLMAMD